MYANSITTYRCWSWRRGRTTTSTTIWFTTYPRTSTASTTTTTTIWFTTYPRTSTASTTTYPRTTTPTTTYTRTTTSRRYVFVIVLAVANKVAYGLNISFSTDCKDISRLCSKYAYKCKWSSDVRKRCKKTCNLCKYTNHKKSFQATA
jgi:hypothetical protein